jgi:hypothetical protein
MADIYFTRQQPLPSVFITAGDSFVTQIEQATKQRNSIKRERSFKVTDLHAAGFPGFANVILHKSNH